MHIEWKKEEVHRRLSLEARSQEFQEAYLLLLDGQPALRSHRSPESLLGMLHEKGCSYAEKDRALHALIAAAQNEPDLRTACLTLLALALWPAIEHSYYKLLPLSSHVADLMAELHWRLIAEVLRFDIAKTSRVAINLQLNVEKAVRRVVDDEASCQEMGRVYAYLQADLNQVLDDPCRERAAKLREWSALIPEAAAQLCLHTTRRDRKPRGLSGPDQEVLAKALDKLVAAGVVSEFDHRLIEEHAIRGVELQEIARQMGLSSEGLRARYFRLKARLQARMKHRSTVTRRPRNGIYSGRR